MSIVLTIEGERYEVSKFDHPGEGIKNIYLRNFHGKEVSELVDRHHNTNEPYDLLAEARAAGEYQGIVYLGPVEQNPQENLSSGQQNI